MTRLRTPAQRSSSAPAMNRLDARNLAPRETLRQLEKDKDTVKGMVR
jgi:hypothetical protein